MYPIINPHNQLSATEFKIQYGVSIEEAKRLLEEQQKEDEDIYEYVYLMPISRKV